MNIMRVGQVNTVSTKGFGVGEFLEENLGIAGFDRSLIHCPTGIVLHKCS